MSKVWQVVWANRGKFARVAILLGLLLAIGVVGRSCWSGFSSKAYWKSSKEYKDEKAAWDVERAKLQAVISEKDKVIAEAQPKAMAFDALAAEHKAADPKLVLQIEEVSRNEVNRLNNAEQPSDCRTRVGHICDLLRARNSKYDCGGLFAECPAGP